MGIDLHLLHPKLVHFPIALFLLALVLEIAGLIFKKDHWQDTAFTLYFIAAILSPLVVASGLLEARRLDLHHPLLDWHRNFALMAAGSSLLGLTVLWCLRKTGKAVFSAVFLSFLLLTSTLILLTAYNGGRLVYEYGVGVEK